MGADLGADVILTEWTADVATLRLDNPAAMNAISSEMGRELHAKLVEVSATARAVILAGHERAFCAGANLAGRTEAPGTDVDMGAALRDIFNPLMQAVKDCRVPIISAVRGAAAGIGASLALSCDMIVAGESAYFLQAFRRIGLVPDGGSAFLLAHGVGRVRAMELMLLGEKLLAPTALTWGLINRVVPDTEVESCAAKLGADLARGPTRALGLIRRAAWAALNCPWEAQLALECDLQREAGKSPDYAEGLAAFLEKRVAAFVGT
jgi:2-(1,2-epoxy-1,2-dihydrophenyl)acetyl-CoA isomerase